MKYPPTRRIISAAVSTGAVIFLALTAIPAFAQLNLVYVETNISSSPNSNTVAGYSNDGAGNLTALPGSPYMTHGTGVMSLDADQEVIATPEGTFVLAVNGGSNSVASFAINSDGSLSEVRGSPFNSGGSDPASLGLLDGVLSHGDSIVTLVNQATNPKQRRGDPSYIDFQLDTSGVLTQLRGTTVSLQPRTAPSQALPDAKDALVFTDEYKATPSTITSRQVEKFSGKMNRISSVPSPDGNNFLGEALHPTQSVIYAGLPVTNALAVLSFSGDGRLSVVNTIANAGEAICWLAINQAGTRLYGGNNTDGTVSVFDLTNPTIPVEIQLFQLSGTAPHTLNVGLDPTQNFLYAVDGEFLHVLTVSQVDGTLTEPGVPLSLPAPAGNIALGVATLLK
jgi:6-phosphogluconolactonase (cycloisomerase 2 family)